jgi:hypothetical protein
MRLRPNLDKNGFAKSVPRGDDAIVQNYGGAFKAFTKGGLQNAVRFEYLYLLLV